MASSPEMVVHRFLKAVRNGQEVRKLHSILAMIPKQDLMAWVDTNRQDILHYAIMADNVEAVDFLLKMGYFATPYEPQVNMYAHLAARLGQQAVMCTILQHRPEDFKAAQQPQVMMPLEYGGISRIGSAKLSAKGSEVAMPAVVGNQLFTDGKRLSQKDSESSMATPKRLSQVSAVGVGLTSHVGPSSSNLANRAGRLSLVEGGMLGIPRRPTRISQQLDIGESLPSSKKSQRRFSSPENSGESVSSAKRVMYTPLDVAARSKHVNCVKALLDMYILRAHPETGSKGYLTLAALANNTYSLKLLLEPYANGTNDHDVREDYRTAVQVCVQNIYPACLGLLLNNELVDTRVIFKQINYFHVMYSQPFNTYLKIVSLARLPVMTENLISDRGYDVKVKMPPRTYPLYSLIDNAFTVTDFSFSEYFVTCIKLLIDHGANPNFDEVEFERQLAPSVSSRFYGGRYAYSSALHCVIQSLERHRGSFPSKSLAIRFAEECVDVLIAHGADIEKMGCIDPGTNQIQGDVLCQFARSSVGMGMERGLLHCLTRFGAQPQRRINGQFALNVYLDTLCDRMKSDMSNAQTVLTKRERDVNQMVSLMCFFMAPWHIKAVWELFSYHHKKCTGEAHEAFKTRVNKALEAQSKLIHSLRTIAAWQVWKLCQRKASNVKKLPVAKELKMHVLPLVLFQTMW